jgi:SAM-dependent methyltransferase
MELEGEIQDIVPDDHCKQAHTNMIVRRLFEQRQFTKVVDLGCGDGNSVDFFRSLKPDIEWIGVDIEASPEVNSRRRKDATFMTFDGIHLPFEDNSLELIYCDLVYICVKHPNELTREITRVLKPGGLFVGQTSQMEPYVSYCHRCYSPWGFRVLVEEAGLKMVEMRPGVDSLTVIWRRLLGRPAFFHRWWYVQSPLNRLIGFYGWLKRKGKRWINIAKLLYCGQFVWLAQKPGGPPEQMLSTPRAPENNGKH